MLDTTGSVVWRSSSWYLREITRREAAWSEERARLVATICHLAGKPLPDEHDHDEQPAEQLVEVSALHVLPEDWDVRPDTARTG